MINANTEYAKTVDDEYSFDDNTEYKVYVVCEDEHVPNIQAQTSLVTFTTSKDLASPSWVETHPHMKSHSIDRISINATLDEQAVVYYVAARTIDGKTFTKSQILSENNAASPSTNNVDVSKKGSFTTGKSDKYGECTITQLIDNTSYDIFFIAKDVSSQTICKILRGK